MNPDSTPSQILYSQPSAALKRIATVAGIACLCMSLSSCLDEDPSYDKEVLKLTAEKSTLQTKLEESEKQLANMKKEVERLKTMAESAPPKPDPTPATPTPAPEIDQEKIKLGFARAVSSLSEQIEQKNPDYQVESVTFKKMKLPSDYPFSSGVTTLLVSKTTGARQMLHWEAQGNTKGEWRFANKGADAPSSDSDATADTTTPQPAPQPTPQPKPATPTDPNTHVIDWGKALE